MPTTYKYKVTNNYKDAATFTIDVGTSSVTNVESLMGPKAVPGAGSGNSASGSEDLEHSPKLFIRATVGGVTKCLDTTAKHAAPANAAERAIQNEIHEVQVAYSKDAKIEITALDAQGNRIAKGADDCPAAEVEAGPGAQPLGSGG